MTKSVVVLLLGCINNQPTRKNKKNPCSDICFNPIDVSTLLKKHGTTKTTALNGVASIRNIILTKPTTEEQVY